MPNDAILVTGAAGFIGFHVVQRLLREGREVVGLDNFNAYYDPALKEARCAELLAHPKFRCARLDLSDTSAISELFAQHRFPVVVHLGAQAGVRHSLLDPHAYVSANLSGFVNILEGCRHHGCEHLLFASSSSVYGGNKHMPFSTHDNVDHPLSLYGATKRANELMAHAYSHLFGLPTTGLRFFTVYGPWGRPDMAMWIFASAIFSGRPIRLFNHGNMQRDFTYVDDVVESICRLIEHVPQGDLGFSAESPAPASSNAPWRIYNIGNNDPLQVSNVVDLLEEAIGKKAYREFEPVQPGDVAATFADVEDLRQEIDFQPHTLINDGINRFVEWYRGYHHL